MKTRQDKVKVKHGKVDSMELHAGDKCKGGISTIVKVPNCRENCPHYVDCDDVPDSLRALMGHPGGYLTRAVERIRDQMLGEEPEKAQATLTATLAAHPDPHTKGVLRPLELALMVIRGEDPGNNSPEMDLAVQLVLHDTRNDHLIMEE